LALEPSRRIGLSIEKRICYAFVGWEERLSVIVSIAHFRLSEATSCVLSRPCPNCSAFALSKPFSLRRRENVKPSEVGNQHG
jgi:hypothetical protein